MIGVSFSTTKTMTVHLSWIKLVIWNVFQERKHSYYGIYSASFRLFYQRITTLNILLFFGIKKSFKILDVVVILSSLVSFWIISTSLKIPIQQAPPFLRFAFSTLILLCVGYYFCLFISLGSYCQLAPYRVLFLLYPLAFNIVTGSVILEVLKPSLHSFVWLSFQRTMRTSCIVTPSNKTSFLLMALVSYVSVRDSGATCTYDAISHVEILKTVAISLKYILTD